MLTEIKMNAGNKGVEKEHEDHHAKDGHALYQENLVSYSVLWIGEKYILSECGGKRQILSYV